MKKSSSFAENRQIRVFISSTFQDMDGERSYLINRTFPTLRAIASRRGVMLTELDLRWGITEEESKSGRVVDICFREIENSVPFFIGIIGNRYGWIPETKDIKGDVSERFPAVTQYLDNHLSVTEMEMQFGVLERKEDMHAFFYIKEPETEPENPVMLHRLKEAVKASRYPCSSYTSLEDLGSQVEKAFVGLLDEFFPDENLSGHQKERMAQQSLIQRLSMTYIKKESDFEFLNRFAEDPSEGHLVVTGESGMGKSALLANWAKENAHNPHFSIIPYFLSNGGNQSYTNVLNYIADEITERCGIAPVSGTDKDAMEHLLEVFSTRNEMLIFLIDAINQISDFEQAKRLNWLPLFPRNIKLVFSTLKEDPTMEAFKSKGYPVYELTQLNESQRGQLVEEYLSKNFGKRLREDQVSRIIEDPQCKNTLVLKTLLDEIICIGRHDTLDEQIGVYLHSGSVTDFYQKVIARFENEYGKGLVKKVLGLLAVSRNGLSEQELISMTGIKPLDWSAFYCSFSTHLNNQSGQLEFTHSYITSTVWNRYLENTPAYERECRSIIADGLHNQWSDSAMLEVPFQLDKLKEWDRLHDYIATRQYLVHAMAFDEVEIATYWRHLFEAMPDKVALEDYLSVCPDEPEKASEFYTILLRLCKVLYKVNSKRLFLKQFKSLINQHPELATAKAYRTLAINVNGPEDGNSAEESLQYAQKSMEISLREHNVVDQIEALRAMGHVYYWDRVRNKVNESAKKAYDVWKQARDLGIQLYGELHPYVIDGYRDMALMADEYEEKVRLALKAVELGTQLYGKDHPLMGRPYHYVGCIFREMERWEEALHYFREAYRVWLPAYGLYHEIMVSSHGNLGMSLWKLGRLEEALECYDTSIRILNVIHDEPRSQYDYALTQFNRARILHSLGRDEECHQACIEVERSLSSKRVREEKRSEDVKKLYLAFRKELSGKN